MRNKLRNIGASRLRNDPGQVNQKIESTSVVKPIIKPKPELIQTIPKPTFAVEPNFIPKFSDSRPPDTLRVPEAEDSIIKQAGTLLSNPFDGVRALGNDVTKGVRDFFGLSDNVKGGVYANLTNLRKANESKDESTKKALSRSSAFNTASQIAMLASGTALTASTTADLLQGDLTSAGLKGLKGFKPVKKLAKGAYMAYKSAKVVE